MILADKPISQTTVLHHGILAPVHVGTLLEGHVELLVRDEELGSDILTRMDLLLRVGTFSSKGKSKQTFVDL